MDAGSQALPSLMAAGAFPDHTSPGCRLLSVWSPQPRHGLVWASAWSSLLQPLAWLPWKLVLWKVRGTDG